MTPFELSILIHHHTRAGDFEPKSALYESTIAHFIRIGVMEYNDGNYALTDYGIAWLKSILSTPLPDIGYYDPRTKERIEA